MAVLRHVPPVRPSGSTGRGRARRAGRRADAVRARGDHGVAASRAGQPGVRRTRREPTGGVERGGRLGLHPVVVEGDRRRGPRPRDPDDLLRRGAARPARQPCTTSGRRRAAWPRSCDGNWRRSNPRSTSRDPGESHAAKLLGILGISIAVEQVSAKFKYGGNVDEPHRRAVAERLYQRKGPGDEAAAGHVLRRLGDVRP